jgi:hypothetical protein
MWLCFYDDNFAVGVAMIIIIHLTIYLLFFGFYYLRAGVTMMMTKIRIIMAIFKIKYHIRDNYDAF